MNCRKTSVVLLKALQEAKREQGYSWAFKAGSVRLERASESSSKTMLSVLYCNTVCSDS